MPEQSGGEDVCEVKLPGTVNEALELEAAPRVSSKQVNAAALQTFAAQLEALLSRQHDEVRSHISGFVQEWQRDADADDGGGQSKNGDPQNGLRQASSPGEDDHMETLPKRVSAVLGPAMGRRFSDRAQRDNSDSYPDDESNDTEISMQEVVGRKDEKRDCFYRATMHLSRQMSRGTDWRAALLRLTFHWKYEVANALLILANALLTAWETDSKAKKVKTGEDLGGDHWVALMFIFCVLFAIDLAVRIVAQGNRFFYTKDWKWNWFDTVVVLGGFVEVVAFMTDSKDGFVSNASVLRIIRLVRVARIVRALRSFVYFRDLRITIAMMCDALIPLATFSSIMAIVFMVFGIFFTDGATDYLESRPQPRSEPALEKHFGSLLVSMSTLFKAITGGIDWDGAVEPMEKLPALYVFMFYAYIMFASFAMLNVISAIFIDQTMQRSKNDREFVVQTEMSSKKDFLSTMERLFEELDPDRSGNISLLELQKQIMDPKVNAYFRSIDLNVFKVKKLFQLMDIDQSGDIDRKEFAQGCTRLRGEAKELDVAILQYEVKAMAIDISTVKNLLIQLGEHIDEKFDVAKPVEFSPRTRAVLDGDTGLQKMPTVSGPRSKTSRRPRRSES